MSDSKQGGGEPSMEEILASIRKIISEDTAQDGQAASNDADADGDPPAAGGSADAQADSAAGDVGDDVLELSEGADTADSAGDAPLDLTDEVEPGAGDADAGEAGADEAGLDEEAPLELDDQVDGDAPTAAEAESAAGDPFSDDSLEAEPAGDDLGGLAGAGHEDAGHEGAGHAADADISGGMDAVDGDPADPAEDTAMLADPFDDMAASPDEPDSAPGDPAAGDSAAPDTAAEAALAAGAMAGVGGAAAGAGGSSAKRSKDTASPLGPEDQRVISDSAEQQAVEQLTSLARQAENAPNDTAADNVDHILARMVRDAVRPQLREWMDRNLPQIVERIVREEVQRMTRRAQGLDDDSRY